MLHKQTNLGLVTAGLLLGILVAAMDNTIVATAMGTIVADLGGLDKIVWVTSAYMVAEMAGMPIFGKLSDMYGRKRFFIGGMILFLLGSILCGTATSIEQLSIYRAIQGIGGGALIPIAFTIMFDIFPPEKRGKMGGLFGAVFGTSSLFGPLLGAYITDYIDWRWIFYINIPIGIVALFLVASFYRESLAHAKQKIDWWGAVTLVSAIVCLMFALELGGHTYAWGSLPILGLFAGFAVLFAAFLFVERKAVEPIISFSMFRIRLFAMSNAANLFYGSAFIIAAVYIPIFVQGVKGGTATNSGLILLPMTLGSVFSAQIGGFLTSKMSYRNIMLISAVIFAAGMFLLSTIHTEISQTLLTFYMITAGFGIGFSFSVLGMATIHHFDYRQRGAANSTSAFLRSLGMTVGITIYGIIQRNLFAGTMETAFGGTTGGAAGGTASGTTGGAQSGAPQGIDLTGDARSLLSKEAREQIPAPVLEQIKEALSDSIAQTFLWAMIPAVLAFVSVLLMSKERLEIGSEAPGQAPAADGGH